MSHLNDNRVAEMSESQFKDSLDALIAGDLDESHARLTPVAASQSSTCSTMPFTTEALHQHLSQPAHQQQSAMIGFHQTQPSAQMSQLTMNLLDGSMFPTANISHPFLTESDPSPLTSSFASGSVPIPSRYASSDASSADQLVSQKSRSDSNSRNKRKVSSAVPVSEDGNKQLRRKVERNAREQKRSQQIVDQIANLRDLLAKSNVQTKADKYSTLVTAAKYIRQLQERSAFLEKEQKKLLVTIGQATDLVNNKYIPVTSTAEAVENVSLDRSSSSNSMDEDAYVHGLDYRAVFLACPVAGAITSIDGRFLDCNEDFEDLTGYTKDELFRKPSESPPFEPSERHMSLFNVLKREDMERLFVVMSNMLRKPAVENHDGAMIKEQREMDRWSDRVTLNRQENVLVILNMKLVRQKNGLPRFFSCSIIPTS